MTIIGKAPTDRDANEVLESFQCDMKVMQAWLAKQTAPTLVPEHVIARQAACA